MSSADTGYDSAQWLFCFRRFLSSPLPFSSIRPLLCSFSVSDSTDAVRLGMRFVLLCTDGDCRGREFPPQKLLELLQFGGWKQPCPTLGEVSYF
ncbi:hypothetical protein TNCV_887031 [Trichonephila clavipes]|uniref:Uncharacterized protein n=1 Tax=Trichonephila clavipes TaxID=2585209 RepID=A0A8X6R8C4_TRICX|nr:hypothetical protein TNCV_887031 [Trichonephila clavipes]